MVKSETKKIKKEIKNFTPEEFEQHRGKLEDYLKNGKSKVEIEKDDILSSFLQDENWVTIDNHFQEQLYRFFDTDTHTQSAFSTLINCVLNAGVGINYPNSKSNKQERQWNSRVWSQFGRQLARSGYVSGYIATSYIEDDEYDYRPIVIDLPMVETRFWKHHSLKPLFRYFEPNTISIKSHQPTPEPVEIFNVITFVWSCPLKNGQLTSKMTTLWQDYQVESFFLNCAITAEKFRSTPLIVTERVQEKFNQAQNNSLLVNADSHIGSFSVNASKNIHQEAIEFQAAHREYEHSEKLIRDPLGLSKEMTNSGYFAPDTPAEPYRMILEENVKVANHKMPETPLTLQFISITRQHSVFAAFGVPPFGTSHNPSSSSTVNKRQNVGSAKNQSNITEMIFLNTQQYLKTQLVDHIRELYSHYGVVQQMVANQAEAYATNQTMLTDDELYEKSLPEITIASIPDEHVINMLYCSGFLKFDATKRMLAQKYGLDENDFEDKPKLTLHELNNIKLESNETKIPATGKTKSKAKKPKTSISSKGTK